MCVCVRLRGVRCLNDSSPQTLRALGLQGNLPWATKEKPEFKGGMSCAASLFTFFSTKKIPVVLNQTVLLDSESF